MTTAKTASAKAATTKAQTKSKQANPKEKKAGPSKPRSSAKPGSTRQSVNRTLILNTVEKLMLEEGYAAVSTRRVAKEAGLKAPLVHYYFPTTDDLFLSVYRRAAAQELEKLDEALTSKLSLKTLWAFLGHSNRIALATEFMALANHRKAIQAEIQKSNAIARTRHAEALAKLLNIDSIKPETCSALGLTVLIGAVARALVMEKGVGISLGHSEATEFVEWWLKHLASHSSD